MKKLEPYSPKKNRYYRNLPHWQRESAIYFVTFRLDGSLPQIVVDRLKKERESQSKELFKKGLSEQEIKIALGKLNKLYFGKFDKLLDGAKGPHHLKNHQFAKITADAIMHFDNDRYKIINFCIMSNHVHLILFQLQKELDEILGSIKKFSSRKINKILVKTGQQFWHYENYDHIIRNEKALTNFIQYNLNNPVKAKLIRNWKDWKWNYINEDFLQYAP